MGSVPKAYCSYLCTVHPNGTLNSTQTAQRVMPCFTLATMPQSNFVWMCGANAVVIPTDDSFIISTQLTIINKRRKRGLSTKHHFLLQMETLDYRFGSFANITHRNSS